MRYFLRCLAISMLALWSIRSSEADCLGSRVTFESDGWQIVADLYLPAHLSGKVPVVLLFNKAAGDRTAYRNLACELQRKHTASLATDLRGHGESTNLGRFEPGKNTAILDNTHRDVIAAMRFVGRIRSIDSSRIALVGASYSGEAVSVASQSSGMVRAIVALSPGSLSDESINGIDSRCVPWLIIVSRDEKHLKQVFTEVIARSHLAETIEMSGTAHATDLLETHPELNAMIAAWVTWKLSSGRCKEDARLLDR